MIKTAVIAGTALVGSATLVLGSSRVETLLLETKTRIPAILVVGGAVGSVTAPVPAPTPTPTPIGGVLSPSLSGLDPISSGLNIAGLLVKSWGTGALPSPEPNSVEGAFRFLCVPSHNAYDDPIVYPGQRGRSHLHTFFGNTGTNANSTYASLRTSGESTCNNLLNRSAYWMPAMMNGRGKVVMPDYVSIYYKRLPDSDPACKTMARACLPLPRGLRYVFGYNMQDPASSAPAEKYWWTCDGPSAVGGVFRNIPQAAKGCPVGARLGARLDAPNCWNGTQLDSADHRSHMAYTYWDSNGRERCPATHPYLLPRFTLAAWYAVDGTLDRSGDESPTATTWFLASDRMQGMTSMVSGTTIHTDWFGAWEDGVMDRWMANCINKQLSCSGGDLGDGQQMSLSSGYDYVLGRPPLDPPVKSN